MAQLSLIKQEDTVAQAVEDESAHIGSSLYLEVFRTALGIMLEENHRILQAFGHELMHQRTMFAQAVGMVALRNHHCLGMCLQAGYYFVRLQIGRASCRERV